MQAGSLCLADQKLAIPVRRVRDRTTHHEVPLATYAQLQTPRGHDLGLFRKVLDGAKGLRAAVRDVFGDVPVQRCQWHRRENVVSYLTKVERPVWRRKLEAAYAQTTYGDAKRALERLYQQLRVRNESAAASLADGLEETLGVNAVLGVSLRSTNLIESLMARLDAKTHRVTRWRTSDQKLRWYASALWSMERNVRKIKGCRFLGLLQHALQGTLHTEFIAAA